MNMLLLNSIREFFFFNPDRYAFACWLPQESGGLGRTVPSLIQQRGNRGAGKVCIAGAAIVIADDADLVHALEHDGADKDPTVVGYATTLLGLTKGEADVLLRGEEESIWWYRFGVRWPDVHDVNNYLRLFLRNREVREEFDHVAHMDDHDWFELIDERRRDGH